MIKHYAFLALIFACIYNSHALASSKNNMHDDGVLHDTHFTGLPKDISKGKIVKAIFKDGYTNTFCINDDTDFEIFPEDAAHFLGKNSDQYYICTSPDGLDCAFVANDDFTVSESNGTYIAAPQTTTIDFSQFLANKKYPDCQAIPSKKLIRHDH